MKKVIISILILVGISFVNNTVNAQSLIDKIINLTKDQIKTDYDNGYKTYLAINGGIPGLNVEFGGGSFGFGGVICIDLDDYLGITDEGKRGWVTYSNFSTASITLGEGSPVGFAIIKKKFDHNEPDSPDNWFDVNFTANNTFLTVNIIGISSNGINYPNISLSSDYNKNLSLSAQFPFISFEFNKDYLESLFSHVDNQLEAKSSLDLKTIVNTSLSVLFPGPSLLLHSRLATPEDNDSDFIVQDVDVSDLYYKKDSYIYVRIKPSEEGDYRVGLSTDKYYWHKIYSDYAHILAGEKHTFKIAINPNSKIFEGLILVYRHDSGITNRIIGSKIKYTFYAKEITNNYFKVNYVSYSSDKLLVNFNVPVDQVDLGGDVVNIVGEKSGIHTITYYSSKDNHTIVIGHKGDPFIGKENVDIMILKSIRDIYGDVLSNDYKFTKQTSSNNTYLGDGVVKSDKFLNTDKYQFSIRYVSKDNIDPDLKNSFLVLDSNKYPLTENGGDYRNGLILNHSINGLNVGKHSYYFVIKALGSTLRYPKSGSNNFMVYQSEEGWDIAIKNTTSYTPNTALKPGEQLNVDVKAENLGKNDYTDVPLKVSIIDKNGNILNAKNTTINSLPVNNIADVNVNISIPNNLSDGIYKIVCQLYPQIDSNPNNNTFETYFYIGKPLGIEYFKSISENEYKVGDSFTVNGQKYTVSLIASDGAVLLSHNGLLNRYYGGTFYNENNNVGLYVEYVQNDYHQDTVIMLCQTDPDPQVTLNKQVISSNPNSNFSVTLLNSTNVIESWDGATVHIRKNDPDYNNWFDSYSVDGSNTVLKFDVPESAANTGNDFYITYKFRNSEITHFVRCEVHVQDFLPTISSIDHENISSDDILTIRGTHFGTNQGLVHFGNKTADKITNWSDNSVTCVVPKGISNDNLYVTNSKNVQSNGIPYKVISSTGNPTLTRSLPDEVMQSGGTLDVGDLNTYFSDPNGDKLTYTVTTSSNGITVDQSQLSAGELVLQASDTAYSTYPIDVTATDPTNQSVKGSLTLTVQNPGRIEPYFLVSDSTGYAPLRISFTDISSPDSLVKSRQWDFDGDGVADDTSRIATYEYTQPGTYTVKLKTSNGNQTYSFTKKQFIKVTQKPFSQMATYLSEPTNYVTDIGNSATFKWHHMKNASSYQLQLLLNDSLITHVTQDTAYTVSKLMGSQEYFWHVRGIAGNDTSSWSNFFEFKTKEMKSVMIQQPTAGTKWKAHTKQIIRWTSSLVTSVNLYYRTSSTGSWNNIKSDVAATQDSLNWQVPDSTTENAQIKIEDADDPTVNSISGKFLILPRPKPDLQAGGFSLSPGEDYTIKQGGSRQYQFFLDNDGEAATPDSITYAIYLSKDNTLDAKDIRLSYEIYHRSLAAYEVQNLVIGTVTIPDTLQPGKYYLGVWVDPDSLISESIESNNTAMDPDPVTIFPKPESGQYFVTGELYNEGQNIDSLIQVKYGKDAQIVEWDSLKNKHSNDIGDFLNSIHLWHGESAIVRYNGNRFTGNDQYIATRHDGDVPQSYTIHANIADHLLDLGSADSLLDPVMVSLPAKQLWITVTSPQKVSNFSPKDTIAIGWRSGNVSQLDLSYRTGKNAPWQSIHKGVNAGDTLYHWKPDALTGDSIQVAAQSKNDTTSVLGLSNWFSIGQPRLTFGKISPRDTVTVNPGDNIAYSITVQDQDGNPVGDANVGIDNQVVHDLFVIKTDADGKVTYTVSVPDSESTGVYKVTFVPSKAGYDGSASVTPVWIKVVSNWVHVPLVYSQGWQMVGVPIDSTISNPEKIYDNMVPGTIYKFEDGRYVGANKMEPGIGYWIRFSDTCRVTFNGSSLTSVDWNLKKGWNMVSGPTDTTAFNLGDYNQPIQSIWGYDGVYQGVPELIPGHAYWVLSSSNTTVTVPKPQVKNVSAPLAAANTTNNQNMELQSKDQASPITLMVKDAAGHQIQLMVAGSQANGTSVPDRYLMPPLPPTGMFDARFSSGYQMANGKDAKIDIQGMKDGGSFSFSSKNDQTRLQLVISDPAGQNNADKILSPGQVYTLPSEAKISVRVHVTSEQEIQASLPKQFELQQNYPNPFNPTTTIRYGLPQKANVQLSVYNILGQKVESLVSGSQKAGWHQVRFDAHQLASGLYIYRLVAGDHVMVRKLMLVK